ncbi:hypothetical protein PGT21_008076 [Puccinia graminis f. sp. tritici]|uniref:Uncharacterized protein n=1 Tax=Puccinia graminis f. sp. tritici TaxID=56615 RepID=A0A5B0NTP7_PUCGR|nr:hypothetical protein PGT21_008076 [Puccinia graminis f. sp. tritici]KAA1093691.1 hypothetical protein PGTUg99_020670 [Puccinia graminis f. sp. tritici]
MRPPSRNFDLSQASLQSETPCLPPTTSTTPPTTTTTHNSNIKPKFQRPAAGPSKPSSILSTELHQATKLTEFSHDFRLLHKSRAVIESLLRRLSWASVDPRPMGTS